MASDQAGGDKAASRRTTPRSTGRVTPKGTVPKGTPAKPRPDGTKVAAASRRYTPPVQKVVKVSPPWVPILMFALLGLGVLTIIVNYLGVLPGGSDNRYLLGGLAAITAGFITATQYR
jgi:hypothetical protein